MSDTGNQELDKRQWRARLAALRSEVTVQQQVTEASKLGEHVTEMLAEVRPAVVCCYVPFGAEPGSMGMLDTLRESGARVLLPVIPEQRGPLDWAVYDGPSSLAPGPYKGVLEPQGERIGPDGVATADLVLVPALAVDERGVRLGRGAAYYDRSLALASGHARFTAVIRDTELVRALPGEEHDVRMGSVLMPDAGWVRLPRATGQP